MLLICTFEDYRRYLHGNYPLDARMTMSLYWAHEQEPEQSPRLLSPRFL